MILFRRSRIARPACPVAPLDGTGVKPTVNRQAQWKYHQSALVPQATWAASQLTGACPVQCVSLFNWGGEVKNPQRTTDNKPRTAISCLISRPGTFFSKQAQKQIEKCTEK